MFSEDRLKELISQKPTLMEVIRELAGDIVVQVLLVEAKEFIKQNQEVLGDGTSRLVLQGSHKEREVLFPFGPVSVKAPRVRDRKGGADPIVFSSTMLPKYLRKTGELIELIPWMYLKGISESDFKPVMEVVIGREVKGFSPATISKLLEVWSDDFRAWESRDMSKERYAYMWADGIYVKAGGSKENFCQLTLLGVDENGRKRLVGMAQGYSESADAWTELLTKLRSQGMAAPKLMTGDGGLGLWAGLSRVFPDCGRQFCWVHKMRDVRRHLPKSRHAEATRQLRDAYMSDTKAEASRKIALLADGFMLKHPKAAETLMKWRPELLGFYDFPAEHWAQVRTTNPIEGLFGTIRPRLSKTRGRMGIGRLGSLMLKLAETATCGMNTMPHLGKIRDLLAGVKFVDGEPMGAEEGLQESLCVR